MKPPRFEYVAVTSVQGALEALARYGGDAKLLAGGQSLTPMLNLRLVHPAALVDINPIRELDYINVRNGGLAIGALTRHRTIEKSKLVAEQYPMLPVVAEQVGHIAIRTRGTFGGSLAHADPAAEWPMVALSLNAEIKLVGKSGARMVKAAEFFTGYFATVAKEGEMVAEVFLPRPTVDTGWGFEEFSRRRGDFAIAAVIAMVTLRDGKCTDARIAMAGVGPTAMRASSAEAALNGQSPSDGVFDNAAKLAAQSCDPSNDLHGSADFRRHLVDALTRRALKRAAERAKACQA